MAASIRCAAAVKGRRPGYNRAVEFLHVADSVNHLSVAGAIAWIATLVGVATGAFIVFGLPAIFQWRRAKAHRGIANARGEENT